MSSLTLQLQKTLIGAAKLTKPAWKLSESVFTEKLEIDENTSLWATYTPDYKPGEPLREVIDADLAIIGGGFSGTSTAYHFSRKYPEKRVVLLEAKSLANGASGRNGGMLLNWVTGVTDHSPEMTQRIYEATHEGIQTILGIIDRHDLDVSYRLDGTLNVYTKPERAEAAHAESERNNKVGIPTQYIDPETLQRELGIAGVAGAVLDPNAGQINGAQFVRGLRPVLVEQGVHIYEQSPVISIEQGEVIRLRTPEGEVRAKAIVLATNGYTGKLGLFRDALFPLHSHVFATKALSKEEQADIGWHKYAGYSDDLDRIAYSTLTTDGHIVFGGGSNRSYSYLFGNRTAYPGTPEKAKHAFDAMEETFRDYWPEHLNIPITHRWTGTLGITLNRCPLMGVTGDNQNIYYAVGYCGHGVTLANMAGMVITDMYSGDDERWHQMPFYKPDYAQIPPEPFRWMGYQMFTRLTGSSPRAV